MVNPVYNLPKISFVGGETEDMDFRLLTYSGQEFDANGCDISFAIINYQNKNGNPVVEKTPTLKIGPEGLMSVAEVILEPQDTANLYGRYVYQLTVRDPNGIVDIPGQGIIDITRNINRNFIY